MLIMAILVKYPFPSGRPTRTEIHVVGVPRDQDAPGAIEIAGENTIAVRLRASAKTTSQIG